jgi:hypothetical protein
MSLLPSGLLAPIEVAPPPEAVAQFASARPVPSLAMQEDVRKRVRETWEKKRAKIISACEGFSAPKAPECIAEFEVYDVTLEEYKTAKAMYDLNNRRSVPLWTETYTAPNRASLTLCVSTSVLRSSCVEVYVSAGAQ